MVNFTLTEDESKLLRWVQGAAERERKDGTHRLGLVCLAVQGDAVIAANGYRLHAIGKPECLEGQEDKLLKGKIPVGASIVVLEYEEHSGYPDISLIIPSSESVFEIGVSPKQLKEALKGFGEHVVLRFYGSSSPIEVLDGEYQSRRYALVMPQMLSKDFTAWRPLEKERTKHRIENKLRQCEEQLKGGRNGLD